MIYNLKFKKDIYLKNVTWDFVLFVSKLYPIQVVVSLPLWIKLTMGQLLHFSCERSAASLAYVEDVLLTNLFWQFVIDW